MENEIKRLKNHLERVYQEISKLQVSGDVVDVIAEVREELREAMRMALRIEERAPSQDEGESPRHASGAALPPLTRGACEEEREVNADAAAENEV